MTFLNVVEIESALTGLANQYPSLCRLLTLPATTAEKRTSHALHIGLSRRCPKPAVLLISGAHAREMGGPDICIYFAADLLEAYDLGTGLTYGATVYGASQVRAIVNRLDTIVFPDINPDGRNYAQTVNSMWRKNRNPASSGGVPSRIGVDVNRNYDFLWDFTTAFHPSAQASGTLASTDPGSDLFHGTSPFSEPETQNVRWLFEQFPRIRRFIDIHSYGGDILFPWGDDDNQASALSQNFTNPAFDGQRGLHNQGYGEYIALCDMLRHRWTGNDMRAAIAGVRGLDYAIDQSFMLPSWGAPYPTSGASDDWAFSRYFSNPKNQKVRTYTIEFNKVHSFQLSWADMEPIIKEIDAALITLCLSAVPRIILWDWLCLLVSWFYEAIWRRVLPPELWGPYGPWGRVRQAWQAVLYVVAAPFRRSD